jgi:hypothetical protein
MSFLYYKFMYLLYRIGAFTATIRKKIEYNQQHSVVTTYFFRNPFHVSDKDRVSRRIFQIILYFTSLYAGYFVELNSKYELKILANSVAKFQ